MVCRPRNRAGPSRAAQEPIRIWFFSTPAISFSAGNNVALTSSNTSIAAQYLYKCGFILLLVAVQNSTFWACFGLNVRRSNGNLGVRHAIAVPLTFARAGGLAFD